MRGESVSSALKNDERAGYRDELVQHLRSQLMAGGTSSSRRQAESELRHMLRRKADNRSLLDALLRMQQDDELLVKEAEMQAARVVCSLAISDPDFEGKNPVR